MMQRQQYDQPSLTSEPSYKEAQTRTRSLLSLFSGLAIATLVVLAFVSFIPSSPSLYAANPKRATPRPTLPADTPTKINGINATLTPEGGQFKLKGNILGYRKARDVVGHIHEGSCMGEKKTGLATHRTNRDGNATWDEQVNPARGVELFFNVHDTGITDSKTGKPKAIGCKPLGKI